MKNSEEEFEKIKKKLSQCDYFLEPEIFATLPKFVRLGGIPEEAIRLLANSFRGYTQIINLFIEWIKVFDEVDLEIERCLERQLKEIVVVHFDPEMADSTFISSNSSPDWLQRMIKFPQWRSLFSELAEKYPNCLMLKFAIRKILDEGYQTEIVSSLTTSCTDLKMFNRVLCDLLSNILRTDQPDLSSNSLLNLGKLVCSSSSSYIYTQALFFELSRLDNQHIFEFMTYQFMKKAKAQNRCVEKLHLLFMGVSKHSALFSCILNIFHSNQFTHSDVTLLYSQYSSSNPPPIEILRFPKLFKLLIRQLFDCNVKEPNSSIKSKIVYILSCMVSLRKKFVASDLQNTVNSINKVMAICLKNELRYECQTDLVALIKEMNIPIVCICLIHWIQCTLEEPNYFQLEYSIANKVPIHFALMDQIATKQPLLRKMILKLLIKIMELETNLDVLLGMHFKRTIIDRMIHLISLGYVEVVLSTWVSLSRVESTEPSLVRYFVCELLRLLSPPYHPFIVRSICEIASHQKVLKNNESLLLIREFLCECSVDGLLEKEINHLNLQKKEFGVIQ